MKICVYPGSFDPVTYGHIDIIERAAKICDTLIVAVLVNRSKQPTFTMKERVFLLEASLKHLDNVIIKSFSGLLIDFVKEQNATTIIKGLRAISDFEYEMQMALLNKNMEPTIETLFMMTGINHSFLSSSIVKELARLGGDISGLVPKEIETTIKEKFNI